jgi:hypothetical protein
MPPDTIAIEAYTRSHRILGRIKPGPTGLYSHFNLPTKSYVEIGAAHLNRLNEPAKLVARYPSLFIVKQEIAAVLVSSKAEIGPTGPSRRGYTSASLQPIHIMLGGFELSGSVETRGRFDVGALLFEGAATFVPLYNAQLGLGLAHGVHAEAQALLFNRGMVDAVAALPREEAT